MYDKNSVEITGTITAEPRQLYTKNNLLWSTFGVCVRRPEPSRSVDYLYVTAWNETAGLVCEEFHAGDRINVRGRIQKQSYLGSDGQKHFTTRIIADSVERPLGDPDEEHGAEQNEAEE